MFAIRYSRCIFKTFEYFNQIAKYSQLKQNCGQQKVRFPTIHLTQKLRFCTASTDDSSEEYKPDFEAIAKGDPEIERKLKVLLLELEVLRQECSPVPSPRFLKQEDWMELVKLHSRSARTKYLRFLFKKEKIKENAKLKKQQKQLEKENQIEEKDEPIDGAISYGFNGSNIFLRFYDTTLNSFYNGRALQAMLFGQKLVIDCGYQQYMTKKENVNCAKQLMLLFADNRNHDDPYDLHFCNFDEGVLKDYLKRQIPTLEDPTFPINLHEESYLDLFPKDKLVYLTPHSNDTIEKYDHDAIYIIGAIVDKTNQEPLSLAKAKKERIKIAKFPLDKYLQWGAGSGKSLTLNQCLSILLDVKKTGDWKYALRHVPKRKLADLDDYMTEDNESRNLRYDRRIRKFKTLWKPSIGLSKSTFNKSKRSGGLLDDDDDDDDDEKSDRKRRVSLKNIFE